LLNLRLFNTTNHTLPSRFINATEIRRMISSRHILIVASLLFIAAPAVAEDLGPPCDPGTPVHEEPNYNKLDGRWRLIVAPTGACNQIILTFNGSSISSESAEIKSFSFAPSCENDAKNHVKGNAGLTGKVSATYCYNSLTSKALYRMHQFVLYNTDAGRPYLVSYSLWDDGTVNGQAVLKGVGNQDYGAAINTWLIRETP
jgi:hypothetical protein